MARPVYPYEMNDPDFAWLLETFQETRSEYLTVQETCLPIVLIAKKEPDQARISFSTQDFIPDNPFEKLLLPEPDDGEEQAEES